jgi:hypothetical protein
MKISVYSQRDNASIHELDGHVFSKQERTKRSLTRLFAFWGLALGSILIPVLHFVLVPLFFLIAPFIARKTYNEEVVLEACEMPCPECKQTAKFAKASGQWPLRNTCPHCMNRVYFDHVN